VQLVFLARKSTAELLAAVVQFI